VAGRLAASSGRNRNRNTGTFEARGAVTQQPNNREPGTSEINL